jgi:oxygen-independent coproporphyrinogen III oxidase
MNAHVSSPSMSALASAPPLEDARIAHYGKPVPRYTSYPTAPHFHTGIDAQTYSTWLETLPENARLSLYAHIPFCDTLCWFCGCTTKITQQYGPVSRYLDALLAEIALIGARVPATSRISHLHWGGGSPTILSAIDIQRLMEALCRHFTWEDEAEFAVEVDPRGMDDARIEALAEAGLTRVSIGVQDFDPRVQAAINRMQSVAETRRVIDAFRSYGVRSLNIDAIYGLPGQGERELLNTLGIVVQMVPDRIALFGYAHVPWMKRHQSMIREADLPDGLARHAHAERAAEFLTASGYVRVGIDHFALPHDGMAKAALAGQLRRNFQGYTVDDADALIGLGASSIGRLPQGYVQNIPAIGEYQRRMAAGTLATERGIALSAEDVMRAEVIEELMCNLHFDAQAIHARYGDAAAPLLAEAASLVEETRDGLIERNARGFHITPLGRPFTRAIAARFDAYLPASAARHSSAV